MKRLDELLKHTMGRNLGIEIAPYFNPALPKRIKPNILTLDVFDSKTLRKNAQDDPFVDSARISEIEEVDLIGSATQIEELVFDRGLNGQIDFVISSHNFEHLPNPIKFLKGCESILAIGGTLSMAIPDGRACFDHFRPLTTLADWLDSYGKNRDAPTRSQIFEGNAMRALYRQPLTGTIEPGCRLEFDDPNFFAPCESLEAAFAEWQRGEPTAYVDCHCSVMTNTSFELIMRDLRFLGITDLSVLEISDTSGHEFFAHLIKDGAPRSSQAEFYEIRKQLLLKMTRELGANGFRHDSRSSRSTLFSMRAPYIRKKKPLKVRIFSEVRRWRNQLSDLFNLRRLKL